MDSKILKSASINEFSKEIEGKTGKVREALDIAFFEILNTVYKLKPRDVKFHIDEENSLVFNVLFNDKYKIYIQYYLDRTSNTLIIINDENIEGFEESYNDFIYGELPVALAFLNNIKL